MEFEWSGSRQVVNYKEWTELIAQCGGHGCLAPASFGRYPLTVCLARDNERTFLLVIDADGRPTQVVDLSSKTRIQLNGVQCRSGQTISRNCFVFGNIDGVSSQTNAQVRLSDHRGWLAEVARSDTDGKVAQAYLSMTKPGQMRGPHEHRFQTDRFLFAGRATIWLWDNRLGTSPTYGNRQRLVCPYEYVLKVVVPPGVVHAYRSDTGNGGPLYVVNAPDTLYRGEGGTALVDEIRHEDDPNSKFQPW